MQKESYLQLELRDHFCFVEIETGVEFQRKDFDHSNHLVFILEGEVRMMYGGLRPRIVPGGSMLFLTPLDNCVCQTLTPVHLIVFGIDSLSQSCDRLLFQNLSAVFSLLKYEFKELEIRPPLEAYLKLLRNYVEQKAITAELYTLKLRELYILFRSYYSAEELAMFFYPLLGKNMEFRKMVTDFYPQVRNACDYASLCGYSFSVFQRKFKEVFGETVYQWMQRQKAEQIKHMLMTSDISLKELAEELHFASPAHLNKFCKVWFGMTPSELRTTFLLKKNLH